MFLHKLLKFFGLAAHMRSLSKDRSTKVGAVALDDHCVVKGLGYNGFPRGVNDDVPERHERPAKYAYTVHAELNVVAQAARPILEGCTLLLTSLHPCPICTGVLIQAGIRRVVTFRQESAPKTAAHRKDWDADAVFAKTMLDEAGVEVVYIDELSEEEQAFVHAQITEGKSALRS